VFVKAGTRTRCAIELRVGAAWTSGTGAIVVANLSTGTIQSASGAVASGIIALPNGWFRIWGTATSVAAPPSAIWRAALCDNSGNTIYTGDGASNAYMWGAQLEAGAFPTSYIPTTTAAATRADDIATMPLGAWYNAATGSLATESMHSGVRPATFPRIVQIDDGTNNTLVSHLIGVSSARVYSTGTQSSVSQWQIGPNGVFAANTVFKVASAWAAGSQLVNVNGANPSSASGATVPNPMNILRFGRDTGNILQAMYLRRVRYWSRALSATELQQVTS
jgi:hypothetical protein